MKREPVLIDSSIYIALAVKYAIYTVWGALAFFNGLRTIQTVGGFWFETGWTIAVAATSAALVIAVLWLHRYEKALTLAWLGFVSIYPFSLIYLAFADPNPNRIAQIALGFGFLVIPLWRFLFLSRKASPSD